MSHIPTAGEMLFDAVFMTLFDIIHSGEWEALQERDGEGLFRNKRLFKLYAVHPVYCVYLLRHTLRGDLIEIVLSLSPCIPF